MFDKQITFKCFFTNPTSSFLKVFLINIVFLGLIIFSGCAHNKSLPESIATGKGSIPANQSGPGASGKYRTVAIADLDNDGNMDIIGGGLFPGTLLIWYGTESKRMSAPVYLPFKGDVQSVATGDFNEDGLKDIVLSVQKESSGIMVWINGSGRKWERGTSPIEINNYQGITTADIDKDGHMDIIAANSTSATHGGIQVWLGDGNGKWPIETGPSVTGVYMDVATADFNHDGYLDIVGAGWGTNGALRIWYGDGDRGWSSAYRIAKGNYYGLSVTDINKDDNMDILIGSNKKGVQIFSGNGKGRFTRAPSPKEEENEHWNNNIDPLKNSSYEGTGSYWQVLAIDLDKDGLFDLVAGSIDNHGVRAWKNNGPNQWTLIKKIFPDTGIYYDMIKGDLDKDGQADILAACFGEGIKIWFGGKQGTILSKLPETVKMLGAEVTTGISTPKENSVFITRSGISEYRIGPKDILEIILWKSNTGNKIETSVNPLGKISFGIIENLYVQGLTATQIDDLITEKLKKYIKNPRVDVRVKEYKSKFVTILGPGTAVSDRSGKGKHYLKGKTSVVEIISDAVSLAKDANLAEVSLRRKNGQVLKLNIFNAIMRGDKGQDVILDSGDVIYIPIITNEANRVYVFGEVSKPGVYTFSGSEVNLLDVLSQAGGPTVFAHEDSTKVVRGDPLRPEVISADLKKLVEEGDQTQNVALLNGDLVYVPRSFVGNVNLFVKKIRPMMELLLTPSRIITDYNDTYDILKSNP